MEEIKKIKFIIQNRLEYDGIFAETFQLGGNIYDV